MTRPTSYDHGTPGWIDLSTPDVAGATSFYSGLFGWDTVELTDDEGNQIYIEFMLDGLRVAGLAQQQPEMAGMPPIWSSYVIVDDCDAVVAKVAGAGGTVMVPTMDVMDAGRMAVFADPSGAVISAWEPKEHPGAAIVNEPNSWTWNELLSRDLEAAKPFYEQVFGWTWNTMDMPSGPYHVVAGGTDGLAGAMDMPAEFPAQVPNHWGVYFSVTDAAAACAKVTELGGTVAWGPEATPVGILATLHDSSGGSFSIMQAASDD